MAREFQLGWPNCLGLLDNDLDSGRAGAAIVHNLIILFI
jgi:hypothetical protein